MVGERRRGVRTSRSLFLIILLFSILIKVYLINLRKFPAGDEIWAYLLTKADLKSIWFGTLSDFHGPFYFMLLRVIKLALPFELNIFFIRIISLIFGIAASFAVWVLASRVLGKKIGLIVFYLSLFLPGFIWASIYARYYSFLILLTTVSIILFLNYINTEKLKNLIILVIITTLGIYTHYYFFLIVFVFFIYLLSVREFRSLLRGWFLAIVSIFFLSLPLLFSFFVLPKPELVGRGYNFILKLPSVLITNLTSFETFIYLYYQGKPIFYIPVIISLWLSTVLLLFWVLYIWKDKNKLLFLYLFLVPPAILTLVSYAFNKPVLALGSLIIFLPSILILVGKGLNFTFKGSRIISLIFIISLFLSLIFFFQSSYTYSIPRKDFQFISDNLQDGDIIINSHFSSFLMSAYYLGSKVTNYGLHDEKTSTYPTQKTLGYNVITTESLLNLKNRIWYLEPFYGTSDEAKAIKQILDNNFKLVKQEIFVPEKEYKDNFTFFNVYLYIPVNQYVRNGFQEP